MRRRDHRRLPDVLRRLPAREHGRYGTQVTLQDNSAPAASLAGPLTTPGWHRPGDGITYSASDNTGIRSATLTAGTLTATDPRSCDFTYKVPCANAG